MGEERRNEILEILKANAPEKTFTPYTYFNKEADALTVVFEGDADYSKRLNDHVTLYLSLENHEIVGCRIKGISGIIEDLPNYININHSSVDVSILFLPFRGGVDENDRDAINRLAKEATEKKLVLEPSF